MKILSVGTHVPESMYTTADMVGALSDRMSPALTSAVMSMEVESRYSVLDNLIALHSGEASTEELGDSVESLSAEAVRLTISRRIDDGHRDPTPSIGLLIAVSNTQSRILPGFAYGLKSELAEELPLDIDVVNVQGMGCSALLKATDVARWYLAANPDKMVMLAAAEAATPYFADAISDTMHYAFGEKPGDPVERRRTKQLLQKFLFGDGAVALLLSGDDNEGGRGIGRPVHVTNLEKEHVSLLTLDAGGSQYSDSVGRAEYFMSPDVPKVGAQYAGLALRRLQGGAVDDAGAFYVHTGSSKIVRGVCKEIGIDPTDARVGASFEVLRHHANMSAASIGFMLATKLHDRPSLLLSFGVGFSASAAWLE